MVDRKAGTPPPAAVALLLAVIGLAYRIYLIARDVPLTNSDEATMGLAALHISEGREFPVFFYGQAYMGTFEAYLAVPLFWLFGPTTTVLRLPLLLLYVAFVAGAYLLTRRLYSPWLAVVTVAALALGTDRIVKNQLIAGGGYPEISPGAVLLLLLAVAIGTSSPRLWRFAVWGLVAGLLFWTDWLVLPYVAASAAVLLLGCRWNRERIGGWRRPTLAVTAGFLVGAAPLLIHNVTAPISQNSISVFLKQSGPTADSTVGDHLFGGVLFGIPMGTGLCSPSVCAPWQMWWAPAYVVLLVVAAVLAVRELRRSTGDGERVVPLARLALLAAAALSLLAYTASGSSAATPVESARYLSCLLVSLPAALWPLWTAGARLAERLAHAGHAHVDSGRHVRWWLRVRLLATASPIVGLLATMSLASVALVAHIPTYEEKTQRRQALRDELTRAGIDRIYSEYWTCNELVFATRERILCAVLGPDLGPGFDRYRPYRQAVAAAPHPAIVVPVDLVDLNARVAEWLTTSGTAYETSTVAGYHIYRPGTRISLPG